MINVYGMAECVNFLGSSVASYEHNNILSVDRDILYQGKVEEVEESHPGAKTGKDLLIIFPMFLSNFLPVFLPFLSQ